MHVLLRIQQRNGERHENESVRSRYDTYALCMYQTADTGTGTAAVVLDLHIYM